MNKFLESCQEVDSRIKSLAKKLRESNDMAYVIHVVRCCNLNNYAQFLRVLYLAVNSYKIPVSIVSDNNLFPHLLDFLIMFLQNTRSIGCGTACNEVILKNRKYKNPKKDFLQSAATDIATGSLSDVVIALGEAAYNLHNNMVFKNVFNESGTYSGVTDVVVSCTSHKDMKLMNDILGFDVLLDREFFKFPSVVGAVKCNLFLRDVLMELLALKDYYLNCFLLDVTSLKLNHNQICSLIIYATNLYKKTRNYKTLIFSLLLFKTDKNALKEINILVKSTGLQCSGDCALLCELETLYGKEQYNADFIDSDIKGRLSYQPGFFCSEHEAILVKELRKVYDRALYAGVTVESLDVYWKKRWARCKAGAHKKRDMLTLDLNDKTDCPNPTRRNFIEAMNENILFKTTPKTLITPSVKVENGKNRVIYSCDTINYLCFDYIVRPVEEAWMHPSILLKPADKGVIDMAQTLFFGTHKYSFNLDYTDFNNQHSIFSMKLVISELFKHASKDQMEWLLASFDNMLLSKTGERWLHSLPSGHRLTTFLNSVLNYTYLACICNLNGCRLFCTGDDCVILANCAATLGRVVNSVLECNLIRVNINKQSLGMHVEFLRMTFFEHAKGIKIKGYGARSVAALVNGNWTSDVFLDFDLYIDSFVNQVITLKNRFEMVEVFGLLNTIIRRFRICREWAIKFLCNELSINNSPVAFDKVKDSIRTVVIRSKRKVKYKKCTKYCYASNDYASSLLLSTSTFFRKISKYERLIVKAMRDLSYIDHFEVTGVTVNTGRVDTRRVYKQDVKNVDMSNRMDGLLTSIMPFAFLKGRLQIWEIEELLTNLGIKTTNMLEYAWGRKARLILYEGFIDYSFLKQLSNTLERTKMVFSPRFILAI